MALFEINDLTNKKFGRLRVLYRTDYQRKYVVWMCICDCGKLKKIAAGDIARKKRSTKSCGCLAREETSKRMTIHGHSNKNGKPTSKFTA